MKDYSGYDTIAFASDVTFQNWVLDNVGDDYWRQVKKAYPNKSRELEEAKDLLLSIDFNVQRPQDEIIEEYLENALQFIENKRSKKIRPIRKWGWVAASVAVLILGYWLMEGYYGTSRINDSDITYSEEIKDLKPGGQRAVLTLGDGTHIVLDSTNNGELASQGGTKILKLDKGQLSYQQDHKGKNKVFYNTIKTPAGGTYQVVLSDGTKVWLNARSSLHFPTSFDGKDRRVELTGEGYFEVANNASHPFLVSVDNMEVKVLGTHFNIKAYGDETNIRTTLLEGRVEVRSEKGSVQLNPGQQAEMGMKDQDIERIDAVDTDAIIAWKNGDFVFDGKELRDVLSTLSRWYDFTIEYPDGYQSTLVYGSIKRDKGLSEVLKIMEAGGIHFKLEQTQDGNHKLIVLK